MHKVVITGGKCYLYNLGIARECQAYLQATTQMSLSDVEFTTMDCERGVEPNKRVKKNA